MTGQYSRPAKRRSLSASVVRCSWPSLHGKSFHGKSLHGKFPLGPARPSGEACRHPQRKTGITCNIGKLASLFNDLFLYNIQSLDGMGRSALAALVTSAPFPKFVIRLCILRHELNFGNKGVLATL